MSAGRSESPLASLREQHKAQLQAEEAQRIAASVPPSAITLEDLIPLVEQKQLWQKWGLEVCLITLSPT